MNLDLIAYHIAKKKADPETLFEKTFIKVKKDSKDYADKVAKEAVISLENTLKTDFKAHGYNADISVKLGKFRGHLFITSSMILLSDKISDANIKLLTDYLVKTYSPKFRYKGLEKDGRHKFNIR